MMNPTIDEKIYADGFNQGAENAENCHENDQTLINAMNNLKRLNPLHPFINGLSDGFAHEMKIRKEKEKGKEQNKRLETLNQLSKTKTQDKEQSMER